MATCINTLSYLSYKKPFPPSLVIAILQIFLCNCTLGDNVEFRMDSASGHHIKWVDNICKTSIFYIAHPLDLMFNDMLWRRQSEDQRKLHDLLSKLIDLQKTLYVTVNQKCNSIVCASHSLAYVYRHHKTILSATYTYQLYFNSNTVCVMEPPPKTSSHFSSTKHVTIIFSECITVIFYFDSSNVSLHREFFAHK